MALRVNSKSRKSLNSPGLSGDELPQLGDMPIYPSQLLFRKAEHFFFG